MTLPVHDVGEEVVVLQLVVHVHLLIVDGEGSAFDAPLLKYENIYTFIRLEATS